MNVEMINREQLVFMKDVNVNNILFLKLKNRIRRESIKEPLLVRKVVLKNLIGSDEIFYFILNGHHRLAIAIQLDIKGVPCIVENW